MPKKKKTGADDPSRAFGGGADNVAFSDIRHIRPDTEDMLEYVLGLRPATEMAPAAEEDALEEDDWDGPPDGADPVAAIAMRIQMLEGLCERLEGEKEKKMEELSEMRKIVNQKEKAVQKLQKEEAGEKMEEELTLSQEVIGTRHQKIFCARETVLSELEVAALLRGLRQAVAAGDETAARQVVTRWVEGYTQPPADRKTS